MKGLPGCERLRGLRQRGQLASQLGVLCALLSHVDVNNQPCYVRQLKLRYQLSLILMLGLQVVLTSIQPCMEV